MSLCSVVKHFVVLESSYYRGDLQREEHFLVSYMYAGFVVLALLGLLVDEF